MRQFRIIAVIGFVFAMIFSFCAKTKAADQANFSVTADQSSYNVGDEVKVSFSVDAGPYASTLSVIDMNIKVSDMTVIAPKDTTNPFVPGEIYSSVGMQSIADNIINVVCYINPNNKPTNRSGLIGTITFTALKAGTVTISYDKIEAAEESKEDQYVTTSASSLILNIGGLQAATTATAVKTATPTKTATPHATSTSANTGPGAVFLVALAGGGLIYLLYRLSFKARKI
jgi:hypothetical protein